MAFYRQLPAHRRFDLIARTPGAEVWRQAQARQLFNRLVRGAVFSQTDGVVGVDHNLPRLHQRGHARRVTGVLDEHQEGGGVGHKAAVVGDAVGNRGHAELAHAVVNVVPGNDPLSAISSPTRWSGCWAPDPPSRRAVQAEEGRSHSACFATPYGWRFSAGLDCRFSISAWFYRPSLPADRRSCGGKTRPPAPGALFCRRQTSRSRIAAALLPRLHGHPRL